MSCMWVSVSDCNQSHIFQLTQLLRQDNDLQIILSYGRLVETIGGVALHKGVLNGFFQELECRRI